MNIFKRLLTGHNDDISEDRFFRSFFAINAVTIADILLHAVYLVLFAIFAPNPALLALQSFAVLIGAVALAANRKGVKDAAAVILTLELGVYSVVWTVFLGGGSYMQWYAICGVIAHYLFTDISKRKRIFLMVFLAVCINASLLVERFVPPVIPDVNYTLFGALTFNAVYFIVLLELLLSNMVAGTAQKRYEESLAQEKDISMKDPLTGLWNRRYLQLRETTTLSHPLNPPNCVAILDLDHFKLVNDSYGHAVGDLMLQHFACLMKSSFRGTDVIIRWGGEEFMIILTGVTLERAGEMLLNFLEKTRGSPLQTEDRSITFTFTAGACGFDADTSIEDAINTADRRLYAGKNAGRNRVVISD